MTKREKGPNRRLCDANVEETWQRRGQPPYVNSLGERPPGPEKTFSLCVSIQLYPQGIHRHPLLLHYNLYVAYIQDWMST